METSIESYQNWGTYLFLMHSQRRLSQAQILTMKKVRRQSKILAIKEVRRQAQILTMKKVQRQAQILLMPFIKSISCEVLFRYKNCTLSYLLNRSPMSG